MITERDLQTTFIILYDNNPTGYNQAFTNAGYSVPSNANSAKRYVVRKMYDLYLTAPATLKTIMDSVEWNSNANNYTTQNGDIRGTVWSYLQTNISIPQNQRGEFWTNLQGWLLGNQTTVTEQTVTTPSSAGAIAGVIGSSLLGIGVIVFAAVLVKRFKGNNRATALVIVGAILLLALAAWLIYKSASKITSGSATSTSTTTGHGGLTDLIGNVSGLVGGWWSNIFGGGGSVTAEDLGCDPTKCDPDRPGYNDCGDRWYPCG